jgi:hypothetical protein
MSEFLLHILVENIKYLRNCPTGMFSQAPLTLSHPNSIVLTTVNVDDAAKKIWWMQLETKVNDYSNEIDTTLSYVKELNSISMVNIEREGRIMSNGHDSVVISQISQPIRSRGISIMDEKIASPGI